MPQDLKLELREKIPVIEDFTQLFNTTGWNEGYQATASELKNALSNSWYALSVYNTKNELIGFARVISDSVLYAIVCDMIVAPNYQCRGIGSILLGRIIKHCQEAGIRVLWLFSAAGKSSFYHKHGFTPRPLNAPGMQLDLNINKGA